MDKYDLLWEAKVAYAFQLMDLLEDFLKELNAGKWKPLGRSW